MAQFSNIFKENLTNKILPKSPTPQMSQAPKTPLIDFSKYGMDKAPIPKATTPVKSQLTNADGSTKTEYHAPSTPQVLNDTETKVAEPIAQPTDQPVTPSKPTYANPLIQPAIDAQQRSVGVNKALNQAVNDRTKQGIALPFVQGQQAALQRDYGVQAQAATQDAQNATQLAQFGQPQQYSIYSQPYNPLTDTYGGGGASGAVNRSVQASNIGSAGDFAGKIQQTQATANAADANFNVLNDYAAQGGASGNVPILNALIARAKQIGGGESSPEVSGFKAQLQAVRAAYQQLTGGDPMIAIPDAITVDQLRQVQQSLKDTAKNNVAGYQKQLGGLQGGQPTSSAPTGGETSAGSWPGWNPQ